MGLFEFTGYCVHIVFYTLISLFVYFTLSFNSSKKASWFFIILVWLYFCSVYGLRDFNSGYDTITYVRVFERIEDYTPNWEPLFLLITKFIHILGGGASVYVFIFCAINIFIYANASYLTSRVFEVSNYKFGALIFFLTLSSFSTFDMVTNGMRQGLSVAFLFLATAFLMNRKVKHAICIFIMALLSHYSSGIFLLLLLISLMVSKKGVICKLIPYITLFLFLISFIFNFNGFEIFIEKLSFISIVNDLELVNRLLNYQALDGGLFSDLNLVGQLTIVIFQLSPILIYCIFSNKDNSWIEVLFIVYCLVTLLYGFLLYQPYSYRYAYLVSFIPPVLIIYSVFTWCKFNFSSRFKLLFILGVNFLYTLKFLWGSDVYSDFNYIF